MPDEIASRGSKRESGAAQGRANGLSNDAATVLPIYLLAIAVQCLHFTEEYVTGFQHQFPRMFGDDWSDARFVVFNMLWLAAFVLAGLGVYRRIPLAYLIVLFLALIGGVGNGASHLVLSAIHRRYFPGLITAPFCLLVGIMLLTRLFAGTRARQVCEQRASPGSDDSGRVVGDTEVTESLPAVRSGVARFTGSLACTPQ